MKLKILKKYPSGMIEIEEIEIKSFSWDENHKFAYVPIRNGHPLNSCLTLKEYEEIVGLTV